MSSTMDDDLKQFLEAMQAETRRRFETVAEDLRRDVDQQITTAHAETRRHFEIVAEDLRRDVKGVADGVISANERIDAFRVEVKEEFVEVRAMIKLSYAELDRRMQTLEVTQRGLEETQRRLEDIVSDLQTRVERLESPTH